MGRPAEAAEDSQEQRWVRALAIFGEDGGKTAWSRVGSAVVRTGQAPGLCRSVATCRASMDQGWVCGAASPIPALCVPVCCAGQEFQLAAPLVRCCWIHLGWIALLRAYSKILVNACKVM